MKETNGYYKVVRDGEDIELNVCCLWEWWIPDDAPSFCGQWICASVETDPDIGLTDDEEEEIIERLAP